MASASPASTPKSSSRGAAAPAFESRRSTGARARWPASTSVRRSASENTASTWRRSTRWPKRRSRPKLPRYSWWTRSARWSALRVAAVRGLLAADWVVVASVALKGDGLIAETKRLPGIALREVTAQSRDRLPEEVIGWVRDCLARWKGSRANTNC